MAPVATLDTHTRRYCVCGRKLAWNVYWLPCCQPVRVGSWYSVANSLEKSIIMAGVVALVVHIA